LVPSPYFSRNKAPNLYVADVNQESIFQQPHETFPTKITWVYGKNTAIEEAKLQNNEEDINAPVITIESYNTSNSEIEFNSQTETNSKFVSENVTLQMRNHSLDSSIQNLRTNNMSPDYFYSKVQHNQATDRASSNGAVQVEDGTIESTVSFTSTEEKNTSETKGLAKVFKSLSIHSPVKSIITEGTELFVTTFLKYDQQNQLVHFSNNDNLFTIDCDKIDGICF